MPHPVHVVIPTHTPRYLNLVLAALAGQTQPPASLVISCDTDDPAIGDAIATAQHRPDCPTHWLRRPHLGSERLCQVRNNAVRLISDSNPPPNSRILILDGDMLATPSLVHQHATLGASPKAQLIYAYRINLDQPTSAALTPESIASGTSPPPPSPESLTRLAKRHRRYVKQDILRKLHLGPPHKPKLLGGHFSCSLDLYKRLNGFDELYQGWGFKDDEFAYRAARSGATIRVAVKHIIAYHLYHETRQPDKPMREIPTAIRFAQRKQLPLIAEHGLNSPLDQPELEHTEFDPTPHQ